MDDEELIQQYKNILSKMTEGCTNLIELKSKCLYYISNAGPYEDKEMLCTKKLGADTWV